MRLELGSRGRSRSDKEASRSEGFHGAKKISCEDRLYN